MYFSLNKIIQIFIYFIPLFLIFSIFVADLLVLLIALFFLTNQLLNKNYKVFINKYFVFFFIFWNYLIVNALFSYDLNLSLSRALPYIRFGLLFLAISHYAQDIKFQNKYFKFILLISIVICFDGLIQFFLGYNLIGYSANHVSRISSFFNEELVLGRFLLSTYPLFLISVFYMKSNKIIANQFFQIFLLVLYSFTIYLSGERTAFFNFLLFNSLLIIIIFNKKLIKKIIIFLCIFIICILTSSLHNKNILERYLSTKSIFHSDKITVFSQTHENHYKTAYKIFKDNKIFGSGIKTFRHVCKKPKYHPEGCATHPHNIFMQFLSELGLIGALFYFIAFSYFIISLLRLLIKKIYYKKFNQKNSIEAILIISMIVTLWPLSPSGNYFNNWLSILNILPFGFLIFYEKSLKNLNLSESKN